MRDSIIKTEDLIPRLKEIGQNAVAITDHGRCLGSVSISKELGVEGIKYIHGCEVYIYSETDVRNKENRYSHLLLLCKNEIGRINLNHLLSASEHPSRFYFKPRITFELLQEHSEGLVVTSACLAGEISTALLHSQYEIAKEIAQKYKSQFGDDFYLEIQSRISNDQIAVNKELVKLSKELGIQLVVTSDAHYVLKEDGKYQGKYAFNGSYKEAGETYTDCYIQSEKEVREKLYYLPEDIVNAAINNTHVIADKCNVQMPLSAPIMPEIDTPIEYRSNTEWLQSLCAEGFKEKLNIDVSAETIYDQSRMLIKQIYDEDGNYVREHKYQLSQVEVSEYIERYKYELDSLERMGFVDYILLVYSYANKGKRRGIARGSGGGSLICYLTNITNIDPIEHGLYFERFIDVGAISLLESGKITAKELKIPDIDLDFSGDSCKEVLRFLYNKYGEDRVASIGRYGTNKTKGTIRDMCRVFDIPLETADEIAKSFENYEIEEIDLMLSGEVDFSAKASGAIEYTKKYPELFEYVRKLNGLPKSFGLHPCGRVISTRELDDFLPSCYDENGIRYLQGDMYDVEDVGLVKVDVLGLRTLDQEYDTLEMSGEDLSFISPKQDYSDPKVLQIFNSGDTVGIFQMSSFGMRNTLKKMRIRGITDLSVANALYRPGAMQYIDSFCNRRNQKESFEFLHPDLEPILKDTYGIMVFQEQLIEIGRMAGIHNPDLLRKATGKKNPKLLAQVKPELEEKLKLRGWSQEQFDKLWASMLDFAKYSFNKSHSSAYGIIAYMTAKEKAYHPAEFYAGLCNSYIGESSFVKDNAREIISDMDAHRIKLAKFNFRNDHRKCHIENGRMVYAVPLIKDLNAGAADVLFEARDIIFPHFSDLIRHLIDNGVRKNQITCLIKLGFFDEFGNSKELLRVFDLFQYFNNGKKVRISKHKVEEGSVIDGVIKKYSVDKNKDGKTLLSYTITDLDGLLSECEERIFECGIDDFDYKGKINTQNELLGFAPIPSYVEGERNKLYILDVMPIKRKKDGVRFGYTVITKSLGSGIESRFTALNALYNNNPIKEGDVIECKGWRQDNGYLKLLDYQII